MTLTGPDIPDQLEPISARGWPPEVVEALGQWRLHAARGHSGRANACWPIGAPDRSLAEAVQAVEAWYGARDLPPLFRPADLPATEALRGVLAERGYGPRTQTLVMVGPLAEGAYKDVRIAADPGDAFSGVFLATAHDPDDAAERMETLLRLAHPRAFAHAERNGAALAIGALAVEGEWAGLFGMRTLAEYRRQGLAQAIIAALSAFAAEAGAKSIYLQVEAANTPALTLYQRRGFQTAYGYRYWSR